MPDSAIGCAGAPLQVVVNCRRGEICRRVISTAGSSSQHVEINFAGPQDHLSHVFAAGNKLQVVTEARALVAEHGRRLREPSQTFLSVSGPGSTAGIFAVPFSLFDLLGRRGTQFSIAWR